MILNKEVLTYTTADTIIPYQTAEIVSLAEGNVAQKLIEMGFLPGKCIRILHSAPFGGPMAFQLDDSIIALRRSEAKLIRIMEQEFEMAV